MLHKPEYLQDKILLDWYTNWSPDPSQKTKPTAKYLDLARDLKSCRTWSWCPWNGLQKPEKKLGNWISEEELRPSRPYG